jgi:hypothetical protein
MKIEQAIELLNILKDKSNINLRVSIDGQPELLKELHALGFRGCIETTAWNTLEVCISDKVS